MTGADNVVRREVFIEASPATVFAFLVDADRMARWMGIAHALEPRPGGMFRVDIHHGNVARGEYREVRPNARVVFSWGWEGDNPAVPPGASLVEIDLTPRDNGTVLVLTHSGLSEPAAKSHTEGWNHYLDRLAIAAAGGDPGADPWAVVVSGQ